MKHQWMLRTFSIVLLLTMIGTAGITVGQMPGPVQAHPGDAAEGAIDLTGSFASGSGTIDDPYLVATAAQLDNVRNNPDAYFLQVADIDLGGLNWWPIGATLGQQFTGHYDGGGYLIKNLTIPFWDPDGDTGLRYIGLFGRTESATFQNIFMSDIQITIDLPSTNSFQIGSLVGNAKNSIIDNVHLVGEGNVIQVTYAGSNVHNYARIGGLVGTYETSSLTLEGRSMMHNVSSNASVSVKNINYVGGLVGINYGTIRHVFTTGKVVGVNRVGGLVGHNASVITDSYSQASVEGENRVGGLAGITWSASGNAVHRSYSTGLVVGTGEDVGGFMGEAETGLSQFSNCYWDVETSGQDSSAGGSDVVGLKTAAMQQQATYRYFNFNTLWQIDEWRDYPVFHHLAAYALPKPVALDDLAGSGTEDDPYILMDADGLNAMRQDLAASYRLGSDIDLSPSVAWNHGRGWMEVGIGTTNRFTGSFDGSGFTIYNLTMNRPRQRPVNYYMGLFGYTDEASFKNIRLEGVNIHCYQTCGTLAARVYRGHVENIHVHGCVLSVDEIIGGVFGRLTGQTNYINTFAEVDVRGGDRTGGIAGNISTAMIQSASVVGSVQGANRVGGLVGSASNSEIYDSFSRASVSGHDEVGGLVGYYWINEIERCYSTGFVAGTGEHVGGLVGRNPRLENDATAGLAGTLVRDDGGVSDSYWDTESSGQGTSVGGIGRSTDEMTYPYAANTYVGWDFAHTWGADTAYLYNAGYPYLRAAVLDDVVPVGFDIFLPLIVR